MFLCRSNNVHMLIWCFKHAWLRSSQSINPSPAGGLVLFVDGLDSLISLVSNGISSEELTNWYLFHYFQIQLHKHTHFTVMKVGTASQLFQLMRPLSRVYERCVWQYVQLKVSNTRWLKFHKKIPWKTNQLWLSILENNYYKYMNIYVF